MSKRNRRKFQLGGQANSGSAQAAVPAARTSPDQQHALEYRIIRNDLIRVVVINALFLAGVLALYFADRQNNILEQFYSKLF